MTLLTSNSATALDKDDPLAPKRTEFSLPEGVIYLDGNSLGALPRATPDRLGQTMRDEWGHDLIKSWNSHDWISLPARVGDKIAPLIGAGEGEVIAADSTSVNLFKLMTAALKHQLAEHGRCTIVTEVDNFPADLYIFQGLEGMFGGQVKLVLAEPGTAADHLGDDTAILTLTHVNYKTGAIHDMAALSAAARTVGALCLWDLSHSAGAVPVDLSGAGADMAVGCGYKYLNGGPGAPAYLYVRRDLQTTLDPVLSGWMGHAKPFDFDPKYAPASDMHRHLAGTPGILGLYGLLSGLEVFDGVSMQIVREKSMALTSAFLAGVMAWGGEYGLSPACPADALARGSQVGLTHENGYAIMQALIHAGVIGDFRAPDLLRFGFTPLYTRYIDVVNAVEIFHDIMENRRWDNPKYHSKQKVT